MYFRKSCIFDLDGTLCHGEGHTDVIDQFMQRITLFASGITRIEPGPDLRQLLSLYYRKYGTTVRGLMEHYEADPTEANEFAINGIDYSVIPADPELAAAMENGRRAGLDFGIFTASPRRHTDLVLGRLGVDPDLFNLGIFTADHVNFSPKVSVFGSMLSFMGIDTPRKACMLEDTVKVAKAAKDAGMQAVLVTDDPQAREKHPFIDLAVSGVCSFLRTVTAARTRAGRQLYLPAVPGL